MLLKSSVYTGNICLCGLQVAELRCSRASVFVEAVALRIDFAHRASPLKPSVYLGIPRSFHFDRLNSGACIVRCEEKADGGVGGGDGGGA